jgi:RNA polymerase sigma-70 factor (ECF subfamily)
MPSEPNVPAELLTSHVEWARRLARRLVKDDHLAEDLVQDAYAAALVHPPLQAGSIRAWLRSVVRNLAAQSHRSGERRRTREELVQHERTHAAAEDLVEQAELQQQLVQAVLQLPERYRTVVLLRFFDGLPPREIAKRLGVPVATVQSQLNRGLQKLREKLDPLYGDDRRAWLAVMIHFARRDEHVLAASLGAVLVNVKIVALVLFVLTSALLGVFLLGSGETPDVSPGTVLSAPAVAPGELSPPSTVKAGTKYGGERVALTPDEAEPVAEPEAVAAVPAAFTVRGRVLDAEKNPVPGAEVLSPWFSDEALTRSGAGGWFEFSATEDFGRLEARRDGWVTVLGGSYRRDRSVEPLIVIAPAMDLTGQVVDVNRTPLADAGVALDIPTTFATHFGEIMVATLPRTWQVPADEEGRFELSEVPSIPGASLITVLDGYQSKRTELPASGAEEIVIVLERPQAPETGAVSGQVLDLGGTPVEGARLGLGLQSVLSDDQGNFHFDVARAITTDRIIAVKPGFLPGELARPLEPSEGETGWPDFVVVRLGDECLSIEGYVVDADGGPRAGVKVWIEDATTFGPVGWMPTTTESLMAGGRVPRQVLSKSPYLPETDSGTLWRHVMAAPDPSAFWFYDTTSDDGLFVLPGLFDREYTLACLDTETLERFESGPHRAGSLDVRIVAPAPELIDELSGTVTLANGDPVAGVRVVLERDAYNMRSRAFGGTVDITMRETRDRELTDETGTFRFRDVPVEGLHLSFSSDNIIPKQVLLAEADTSSELTVVVEGRFHMEVRIDEPKDRVDSCLVRGADGDVLSVRRAIEGTIQTDTRVSLVDGASGVLAVSSEARTVEFFKDGEVVGTLPVELYLGEVVRVEY